MNKITLVASVLLGLLFIVFGSNFFLKFMPTPKADPDSLAAQYMGAMFQSGWLKIVKSLQIIGGLLLIIPKTRNFGLLVLGPIVINIGLYNILLKPGGITAPPVLAIMALAVFLLVAERKKFAQLLH